MGNWNLEPFARLWRGEQPLARAFWGYFVLGSFLALIAGLVVAVPLLLLGIREATTPIILLVRIAYPIFAGVGVWRSANAYLFESPKVYALKAVTVLGAKLTVLVWVGEVAVRATGITTHDVIAYLSAR